MANVNGKEYELVTDLARLLRKSGDKILNGESKLSLTTQSLSLLNVAFRRYSETGSGQVETTRGKKNVKGEERLQNFKTNAQYLHDFITKTVSLKIIHGTNTMQGAILISRFRNLQVLELKKVPIHMLEGLQKLRSQLQCVIVSRSLQNLQDLFETCGGDMSAPMSWPEMKSVYLSYNGLSKLDGSLRLLPALEVFDLSHNAIHKTENFLEYLTEILRLNIGYNFMDSVPTFSLSAKSKLRTLVLRNNNLDNLEGIDELVLLEELDVSENCLVDHSCLVVLNGLNKLYMLGLQGNPLSFHRSHRSLTLQHISPAAGKNEFILDNKKITVAEMMLTQRSGLTASRRPSQEAQSIYTHARRVIEKDHVSQSYNFSDSENIATTLRVGSPHTRRSRKKKPRVKSKLSEADSGTDVNDEISPLEISTDASSRESSRVPSPVRIVEGQISTKEEIEVIREHYGTNWLQVITAKTNESINTSRSPTSPSQTEDDIYMNESTAKLHTVDDDIEVIPEPNKPDHIDGVSSEVTQVEVKVERENSGEIYSTDPDPDSPFKETDVHIHRQYSTAGVEWNRDAEEQMEYYGAESEPFIVSLSSDITQQLIIAVNQRYIIEKDLNGRVTEMLDLKCLELMRKTTDSIKSENLEEDITAPVLKLKFNYIKKDRRERTYVMEDDSNADELESLLQPFLDAREIDNKLHGMLQCLKCSSQFYKKDAKFIEQKSDLKLLKIFDKSEDKLSYNCPKCGSGMVVELDVVQKPKSRQTTPKDSLQSTPKGSRQSTPKGSYTSSNFTNAMATEKISPIKSLVKDEGLIEPEKIPKSHKLNDLKVDESETYEEQNTDITGNNLFQTFKSNTPMSRSDGFRSIQNDEFNRRSSTSDKISSVTTPTENQAFQRNDSWSEVNNALQNKRLNKRRSADSDITILTNASESSVTVISESSVETTSDLEQDDNNFTLTKDVQFSQTLSLPLHTSNKPIPERNTKGENGTSNKHLNGITEETGEATPIGSPLSTSVCSSMVSSVYENSINHESKENLCAEDGVTGIDRTNVSVDVENNNEEYKSIYDSHNDNDSVDIYDTSVDNGTKNVSSSHLNNKDNLDNSTVSTSMSPLVHSVSSSEGVIVLDSDNLNSDKVDSMETSVNSSHLTNSILEASCEEVDFTKLDHRVKLFLMMNVIENADELNCAIECDIMQYMNTEEFKGTLIMCTDKVIILKVLNEDTSTESLEDCMICIENQPITELQYIDIGLGYQSFRFEFGTDCASYTFIVRDEGRCKQFISLVTELVQSTAFSEHSKLEGISKYNATTLENLQITLLPWKQVEDEEVDIVKYLMCYLVTESGTDGANSEPVSIVVTYTDMFLVKENHQWPIPRLQAPLNDEIKGQQFYVKDSQKINNIATFECCEEDPTQVKVTFFNEESQEEVSWHMIMVTLKGVQSLVNAIREPWESEFGVNLDISSVSLNDM